MPGIDPTFNGVALSDYGFVASRAAINLGFAATSQKSALADGGAAPEGAQTTTRIVLSGTLHAADDDELATFYNGLLEALAGNDRTRLGRLDVYNNGYHYWCQQVGNMPIDVLRAASATALTIEFEAADPFKRRTSLRQVSEWLSGTDPTMSVDFSTDFTGNAPRIPIVIKPGNSNGWAQGDLLRIYNSTAGWRFEHVVTQALAAGQNIIIDGETGEVFENGIAVAEGASGGGLYLQGGVTNVLTFSGTTSTRLSTYTVEFYDRYRF